MLMNIKDKVLIIIKFLLNYLLQNVLFKKKSRNEEDKVFLSDRSMKYKQLCMYRFRFSLNPHVIQSYKQGSLQLGRKY